MEILARNIKEEININNKVFIDLDKKEKMPQLAAFQGQVDIKKNGKIIVKNSILENIDTYSEEELRYIFTNLKEYISPIVTSQYIPSASTMEILRELAPEFKVRFKTEKMGASLIVPISSKEFFEGEEIFNEILNGIKPEWTEKQKYKYLYNKTGEMLSYDLNVLSYTAHSNFHDKYSRNIFTAISKNWGVCESFAAVFDYLCYRSGLESSILSEEEHSYVMITTFDSKDYLTDPTFDSVALKFGMRTKNFCVSKEVFQKNGHNLDEAEVEEYDFESIDTDEVRKLDMSIGYLDEFGGEYTNEYLSGLANNLIGNNNFEKALNFMKKIRNIKSAGRPTVYDYEETINWILSKCEDKDFVNGIKVYSFIYEDSSELPRKLAIEVSDDKTDEKIQYYISEDGIKSFERVDEIQGINEYRER